MNSPEFLTVGEVAANFGWTVRFVDRLAEGGNLPGVRVEGQWRFGRDELIDWLDQKMQTLDHERIADLEHQLETELQAATRPIHLAERLAPETIALRDPANSAAEVLRALVGLAAKTGQSLDDASLHASLVEREALCSTALPGGFAICHPRRPLPLILRQTVFAILRTDQPVPFGEASGGPTRLFFLIAATDDRAHLYALARLTRVLRGHTVDELFRAETPDDVIALIRRREVEIDVSTAAAGERPSAA